MKLNLQQIKYNQHQIKSSLQQIEFNLHQMKLM